MLFGDILKKLRNENELTQKELAQKINVSPGAIGLYEQNRREPEFIILCKIADFFNVDIDYLLGRSFHNKKDKNEFRNAKDAIYNLLSNKQVQKYAGYDFNKLKDSEINSFANDLSLILKITAHKYKK